MIWLLRVNRLWERCTKDCADPLMTPDPTPG